MSNVRNKKWRKSLLYDLKKSF